MKENIMIVPMLKKIALDVVKALVTEKFIKEAIVYLLVYLSKKTDNTIDDKVVSMIEKAMNKNN